MSTIARIPFVIALFALGSGCAVNAESAPEEAVSTEQQAITLTDIRYIAPQCRAVFVSSVPTEDYSVDIYICPEADPYTPQVRYSGFTENGGLVHVDEAVPGEVRCSVTGISPLTGTCKKTPDLLFEKLCGETRTYQCPCGVSTKIVDHRVAGFCQPLPP